MPAEIDSSTRKGLTKKAVIGTSWSALSTVARQGLALVCVGIMGRLLGPDAYGIIGMATLLTNFLTNFRDLGTGAAIVQREEVSERLLSTLFWMNAGIGLLLTTIVMAASYPLALFFREPKVGPVTAVMALSFSFTACGIVTEFLLRRRMAFQYLGIADFAGTAAGYGIGISCALHGLGVWSLVAANLVNTATASMLYFVFARWRPRLIFDTDELRSVARFGLNMSGFTLVNFLARNSDNIVVGRVLGGGALGYYQMAYNLMMFPIQNISGIIAHALFPGFARIQQDDERFRSAYIRSCMLIGFITFPVIAGLGVVAEPFVLTVLGNKWAPVIPVFQILAPVGLVQSIYTTSGLIFTSKGRTDLLFRLGLFNAAVVITSFLIGVHWGVTGVATAYAVSFLGISVGPAFYFTLRLIHGRLSQLFGALAPQLGITLAMAAVAWIVCVYTKPLLPVYRLILASGTGFLVYVALMLIIRPPVLYHLINTVDSMGNARLSNLIPAALRK